MCTHMSRFGVVLRLPGYAGYLAMLVTWLCWLPLHHHELASTPPHFQATYTQLTMLLLPLRQYRIEAQLATARSERYLSKLNHKLERNQLILCTEQLLIDKSVAQRPNGRYSTNQWRNQERPGRRPRTNASICTRKPTSVNERKLHPTLRCASTVTQMTRDGGGGWGKGGKAFGGPGAGRLKAEKACKRSLREITATKRRHTVRHATPCATIVKSFEMV
jgi:hypothetical protein